MSCAHCCCLVWLWWGGVHRYLGYVNGSLTSCKQGRLLDVVCKWLGPCAPTWLPCVGPRGIQRWWRMMAMWVEGMS